MITRSRRDVLRAALAGAALASTAFSSRSKASPGGTYVSLSSLGGRPNDSEFDNGPAFNAALEERVQNLYIPSGIWYFHTKPNDITYPLEISGEGFVSSYLVRRYFPESGTDALLSVRSSDCRIARIGIGAGLNTAGGAGIALLADAATKPDFSVIEDVYISIEHGAPGTWENALVIDGIARTVDPIGARGIEVRNCYMFASTNAACRINGGVSITVRGGGMYPAAGNTGRLQITGSPGVCSHYVNVDAGYIGGLDLDHCRFVSVRCGVIGGDITNRRTAEDVLVSGRCTGVTQQLWTRGRLEDSGSAVGGAVRQPSVPQQVYRRRLGAFRPFRNTPTH